ncbi:hypothetical protein M9458_054923, partial [Cirrhinus mrigala]
GSVKEDSVQKGRVQVRGGVWRPHSLPAERLRPLWPWHFLRRVNQPAAVTHLERGAGSLNTPFGEVDRVHTNGNV